MDAACGGGWYCTVRQSLGLRSWQVIAHWVRPASVIDKLFRLRESTQSSTRVYNQGTATTGGHLSTRLPQKLPTCCHSRPYHNFCNASVDVAIVIRTISRLMCAVSWSPMISSRPARPVDFRVAPLRFQRVLVYQTRPCWSGRQLGLKASSPCSDRRHL